MAQRTANDWINPAQTYFKIPTIKEGIYRLNYTDLRKAGLPTTVNPQALQLFHRGEELSIFVQGESDGTFDAADFVEFYGKGNDGTLDSALYYPREAQPNRFYNLYSDTTAYFLTWRLDNGKGQRMATYQEANTQNLTPEPYYWVTSRQVLTGDFGAGTFYPLGSRTWSSVFYTHYDWGEGYTSGAYKSGTTGTFGFDLSYFKKDAGVVPQVEYQLLGRNPDIHSIRVTAGPQTGIERVLGTISLNDFHHKTYQTALQASDITASGFTALGLTAQDPIPASPDALGVIPWNFSVNYVQIRYPAQPIQFAPLLKMELLAKAANRSYLEVANVAEGSVLYDLTDERHPIRIGYTLTAGAKLQAIVQQSSQPLQLLLTSQFTAPLAIRPVRFRTLPAKASYLIVSHEALMKPAGTYADPVHAYAAYRASTVGGHYDTLVVTMNQIVDQFNYGEWSPLAIRNFAEAMNRRSGAQFLFLMGQGRWPNRMRTVTNRTAIDPLPPAGFPTADMPLVMSLSGKTPYVPSMAVGRLNAALPIHVANYFNKVKEQEAAAPAALWRKKMLHLSGGKTPGELSLFRSDVDGFKKIAESGRSGVNIQTLSKKSDEPVEVVNIAQQINDGVGMVTFFGHSGGDITDIDIGFASNDQLGYRNKGKYPLILVNGCDAGDIFFDGGQASFGTDWVNTPDRGAILMLAQASTGYPVPLKEYSDLIYTVQFTDTTFTGKPFGLVMKEAIRRLMLTPGISFYEIGHAQQFMLQGDPAVVLLPVTKPDYSISNTGLALQSINGTQVVASADSFRLAVVISNLGRVPTQAVQVSVKRTLSNGTVVDYGLQSVAPVAFQDTIYITLRNDKTVGGGANRFDVVIDPNHLLDEISRDNNQASLSVVIAGYAATPLFPPTFGVINTTENNLPVVTMTAQSNQVTQQSGKVVSKNFAFELDTSATFNSPYKQSKTIAADWLPSWKASLLSTDSLTYYWRIRDADQAVSAQNGWTESSFSFVKSIADGWGQLTVPQLSKATGDAISLTDKGWTFQSTTLKLQASVTGANSSFPSTLTLNGTPMVGDYKCYGDALIAVAFQPVTLEPYSILPAQQCGYSPFAANFLPDGDIQASNLLQQYLDALPKGAYVLLMTAGTVDFAQWTAAQRQQLSRLGVDPARLATWKKGSPYLALGQIGGKALAERFPDASATRPDTVALRLDAYDLRDTYQEATVTSPLIGPALEWGEVSRKIALSGTTSIDLVGVTLQGAEVVLQEKVAAQRLSLQSINAKQYPYLRLRLHVANTTGQTPQLKNWLVAYKGVPEGAIDPTLTAAEPGIQKGEGELYSQSATFRNISNRPFTDSLTVRQTVTNRTTGRQSTLQWRVAPPAPNGIVAVTQPFSTQGKGGENLLNLTFNPQIQPEQYYTNNSVETSVTVVPDKSNPVLEVTFDGRQIDDGELVSASPKIDIRLKDENLILVRKDTTGIDLRWQRPADNPVWERIAFKNPLVTWKVLPDNDFRAEFHPQRLPNGVYALQVQGTDLSGNFAGGQPYLIHFEVKNSDTLTIKAYPNPLTAFTRFSLSIGGETPPTAYRVRLYSAQGILVRELQAQQPRAGVNELFWDGTDAQGAQLPNGLYLYQIFLTNEENSRHAGKIVITR